MALDAAQVVVANSGHGYIAPVGTTLPTAEDDVLDAAFEELGYFSEQGVTLTFSREKTDFGAWQARLPIRSIIASEVETLAFEMEQWNPTTTELALGGGAWTEPNSGHFKFTPADPDDGVPSWAFVLEFNDEAGIVRFVTAKVELAGDVAIVLSRNSLGLLPVTVSVLETGTSDAYNLYTDLPQFAGAS